MPDIATHSSVRTGSNSRLGRIDLRYAAWFSLLVAAGIVATLYPLLWLGCLAGVVMLGVCWVIWVILRRAGLELWQVIALTNISGYLVLNYGYDNLCLHAGGFPLPVAYGMMWGSFGLAVMTEWKSVVETLREPALLCCFALLALAFIHLVTDIPTFGSLAFRDATMCFDALFLILGMAWAKRSDGPAFLPKWLFVIFIVNMFYSFTLPWAKTIWSWSPESGAYLPVPVFGNFHGSGDLLLEGALFCLCVGGYVMKRSGWLMSALVMGQLLGIAITQVRRMYLGIVVVIFILILAGEIKKFSKLFILVPVSLIVLFAATSIGGLKISGRIGEVSPQFFIDHLRSIGGAEDTPGSDPQTRVIMAHQAYQHFLNHPVLGEGFGQPVVEVIDEETGTPTRTPHNSTVCYLARLGAVGIIFWAAFHICLWIRFFYAYLQRRAADKKIYTLVLWLFLYYVLYMMSSLVESPFEYPGSAIPFYFLIGIALGMIRWQLYPTKKRATQLAVLPNTAEKAYS
jgi:O-antigen ligase